MAEEITQKAKKVVEQQVNSTEFELLKAKLDLLESKQKKSVSSEEQYQARVAAYEAKAGEREKMKTEIRDRQLAIMQDPQYAGKCSMGDAALLEAWARRLEQVKDKDPIFANTIRKAINDKKKDIKQKID